MPLPVTFVVVPPTRAELRALAASPRAWLCAVLNLVANLRLMLFGALIIFFLIVEPEGLNRLWRNIRSYFRVWPFAY